MLNFDPLYLISVMPGHVYWLDKENVYQGCNNQQAESLSLQSRHEIIGKKNSDFLSPEYAKILDANNIKVMKNGMSAVFQESYLSKEGRLITALSHKVPLRDANHFIVGLLGISLDISELKEAQQILKSKFYEIDLPLEHILAHMPGNMYWKNTEGVYLGCNDKQAKTVGLSYAHEVIGKTDFDILNSGAEKLQMDAAEELRKNDLRIMSTGLSETIEETVFIDNNPMIFLSLKAPLKDKIEHKTIGVLGISVDITKQKYFEQQLVEAKEIAEKANSAKSEFLYNMRHDLKTPFGGILGMAECLELMEQDLDKKEKLGYIKESARVFLDHLDQIFDFINIEQGQIPILKKQFNLKKSIDDVFKMLLLAAKNKNLAFAVHVSDDCPAHVIGDQIRIERILMNLLSNSVKFTEKGFIKLSLSIIKKIKKEIIFKFTIEDTGIGIPEDKIDLLFQSFNRLMPSFSSVYPGKGLGLRVVKEFVDEMNGEIHVHSELGRGTVFKVLIPFKTTFLDCSEQEL